jgi:hypothetical protein
MRLCAAIPLLLLAPVLAAQTAPTPVPSGEPSVTGSVDVGYQAATVGGSVNTYRSVVNLGDGIRLFGADFSIVDPKKRLFDRLDVRASDWGNPYNTIYVDAGKQGLYKFHFDYRDIAYFDFLPSFADPLLATGTVLDERSYNTHRRMSDFSLDLFPGRRIIPYLVYSRDAGRGDGITTFVSGSNEYPVTDTLHDATDNYRGGVHVELHHYHLTFEQGGTTFRQDQQADESGLDPGNRMTPYVGQQLYLDGLAQAYGVRGDSIYTKALLTANPVPWADFYGQFLYSQPQTSVNYTQLNTGNLVQTSSLLFYTAEQALGFSEAKQPHTAGSLSAEIRPLHRVRILETWRTDRLHTASAGLLMDNILLPATSAQSASQALGSPLFVNYNQEEIQALVDVTRRLTLRGGYRYDWGNAAVPAPILAGAGTEFGQLQRHVGLAGLSFRPSQKIWVNLDFEGAAASRAYFRTSLYNYQQARARVRYQVLQSLTLSANFSAIHNDNPTPGIQYDFLGLQTTLSASWTPNGGKRFSVLAEYTRSTLHSDINYLVPQTLTSALDFYRDNAHTATSLVDIVLPGYAGLKPRVSVGGSLFISSGSRPTRFYQPLARLSVPLHKHISWNSEWRYYGFGEPFYLYEAFRAQLIQTGLHLTR